MKTTGDKILDQALNQIGGKGLFVKELDRALLDGRIDISVHSLKDMPMEIPEELPVLAWSCREDKRDVLILRKGLSRLPEKPVIGTGSSRRIIQAAKLYPKAEFKGIRGNIHTRLRKLDAGEYDALILAAAGIRRMGLEGSDQPFFLSGRDDSSCRTGDSGRPGKRRGHEALSGKDKFERIRNHGRGGEKLREDIRRRVFLSCGCLRFC